MTNQLHRGLMVALHLKDKQEFDDPLLPGDEEWIAKHGVPNLEEEAEKIRQRTETADRAAREEARREQKRLAREKRVKQQREQKRQVLLGYVNEFDQRKNERTRETMILRLRYRNKLSYNDIKAVTGYSVSKIRRIVLEKD